MLSSARDQGTGSSCQALLFVLILQALFHVYASPLQADIMKKTDFLLILNVEFFFHNRLDYS